MIKNSLIIGQWFNYHADVFEDLKYMCDNNLKNMAYMHVDSPDGKNHYMVFGLILDQPPIGHACGLPIGLIQACFCQYHANLEKMLSINIDKTVDKWLRMEPVRLYFIPNMIDESDD